MKKTLALALVLVMVISSVCVLFVSADEVETVKQSFTQAAETKTDDSTITLWKKASFTSSDAGIDWSFGILVNEKNELVGLGRNFVGTTITVPEGNSFIACHFGDGEKTNSHLELKQALQDLGQLAGLYTIPEDATAESINAILDALNGKLNDVSSVGWHVVIDEDDGDFGSFTLYKGAVPAADEPEEPAKPETVKEEINVDGDLKDTGWDKAEWKAADSKTCKAQSGGIPETFKFEYAVRADDNNVYVAVKVNAPAHSVDNNAKPTLKIGTEPPQGTEATVENSYNKQYDAYRCSGSAFRIYLETNLTDESANFDKLIDILVVDGKPVCYLGKDVSTAYTAAVTTTETESFYEIQLKKSDLGIGDTFKMAVSYSDKIFGENNDAYDVLNDHMYTGGDDVKDEPWKSDTHYTTYTVEELKLGTYTKEPPKPSLDEELKALEEELKAKVTEVADADFKIALTSKLEKNDAGKLIYTVNMTLKDIKPGVQVVGLTGTLHYDPEVLRLTNETFIDEEEDEVLDIVVKVPNKTWENLSAVVTDDDGNPVGELDIELGTRNGNHYVKDDAPLELQLTFEVLTDAKVVGVYVDSEGLQSTNIPAGTIKDPAKEDEVKNYKVEGAYTAAAYADPADQPSEPSGSTPTNPSKPGDAGILIFAVLGIVAIAGAVTVIKVRR